MPRYVDGFVIPVPKRNVAAYAAMSKKAGKVWKEHGALDYIECVGDDIKSDFGIPFVKLAKTKPSETVVFSYIVYKSKAQRDKVNAKVMKDKRITAMMHNKKMPFDVKRMTYGGFKMIVDM
ncbi:MAG: DUF1428 domain-containing protein [Rhodospirillales bacterium]|nr:DUF1428 domain-containing protein [Rhodospirillales bacterium]